MLEGLLLNNNKVLEDKLALKDYSLRHPKSSRTSPSDFIIIIFFSGLRVSMLEGLSNVIFFLKFGRVVIDD